MQRRNTHWAKRTYQTQRNYAVIGGYGEIGQIIARDLFEHTGDKIWIAGHDAEKAYSFAKSFHNKRIVSMKLDAADTRKLAKFLKNKTVCINAAQYYFNLDVMKACLQAKVPYVDLGGLFHMTKKQLKLHNKFKKAGLTAVIGCGATPGITNVMAAYGASQLDKIKEIHIKFGGAEFTRAKAGNAQPFVLPYSAKTLLDEFSKPAASLIHGKMRMIQPFSDEEYETFPKPVGKSLCGSVLHSELATFLGSFRKKGIQRCTFKGSFGEDFTEFFKLLVKLGFAEEPRRAIAVEFLNKFLPKKKIKINDIEILRLTFVGKKHGKNKKIILDLAAKSNPRWNTAASIVDTASPASIIAQFLAKGLIKKSGVFPPELIVPQKEFFQELKKRGMQLFAR